MAGLRYGVVAACEFNSSEFLRRLRGGEFDAVVAVDGGFAHLEEVGCKPDIVIGDFDSLGFVPEGDNVVVHPSHKDKSDLELVLDYVAEQGGKKVTIFGALGGRLDHTIANLQMCARFAEAGMTVDLLGAESAVRILVGPDSFDIPVCESGTVSVFSAVDESHGVVEQGMEYPLDASALGNRTTLGLSNELVGEPASVSVEEGTLYVFYPI